MTQTKTPDRERARDTSSQNADISALKQQVEELGKELETGLDDLCEFFYKAQKAKSDQQTNIVLLSLILLCLLWLNIIQPLLNQVGGIAQMPREALQSAKVSLSKTATSIRNKIPFLPKATGSLKISGEWAEKAGRGDKFVGGKFTAGSPFGPRVSPGGIGSTYHRGQDVPMPEGTPIYAVGTGKISVRCNVSTGGGNQVFVDLGSTVIGVAQVDVCQEHTNQGLSSPIPATQGIAPGLMAIFSRK